MSEMQTRTDYNSEPSIGMTDLRTLYATFENASFAEKAAGALLDHGVKADDISLVSRGSHNAGGVHEVHDVHGVHEIHDRETVVMSRDGMHSSDEVDDDNKVAAKVGISTTTPADAAAGATKGAGIGLGVGIAAALVALLVPGFGLVAGGGALAMAIAGAAGTTAAGAVAGGVTGYLKDQGMPEDAVNRYAEHYDTGGAILSVAVPSNEVDADTVQQIISKYGGSNVNAYRPRMV